MADTATDIPQAATIPVLPDYLTEMPSTGFVDWTDQKVELFDFSFLGIHFAKNTGGKDQPFGVNKDLAGRLREAQKVLYAMALQEKTVDQIANGKPAPDKLTEAEFRAWCWAGQEPLDKNLNPQIAGHIGIKDIKHPRSRHASGSAVDLNVLGDPYMPVRDAKGVMGGEIHSPTPPASKGGFSGDVRKHHEDNLWGPTMKIFDRAHTLIYGIPADIHPDGDHSHAEDIYRRFKRLSYCLQIYLRYGFFDENSGQTPLQKPQSTFDVEFLSDLSDGLFDNAALHVDGTLLLPQLQGPTQAKVLKEYYDQIVADHEFVKLAIVSGSVQIAPDGTLSLPANKQRDPCKGVFNIRNEVFVQLVKVQKLRWGGSMFGRDSGDTMHFDLNGHFIDGKQFPDPAKS